MERFKDVVLTEEEKDEEYKLIIDEYPGMSVRDILRGYARACLEMSALFFFEIYLKEKEAWKNGASLDDLHPIFSESICLNCGKPSFDYLDSMLYEGENLVRENVERVDKYYFDVSTDFESLERILDKEAEEEKSSQ